MINEVEGVQRHGHTRYAHYFSLIFFYLPSVAGHHPSVARMRDGGAFLPTNPLFNITTTPPSLEREMDGLFYPPTPHLTPPTPLPRSNVRRRGFFGNASLFNTTATSLTRMRDGWAFLPTTTRLTPLPWHSNASFLGNHYPSLTHSNAS